MAKSAALGQLWAYVGVVFLQVTYAGLTILVKSALNKGMNPFTFVVYRHVVASVVLVPFALALERKTRPKMTTKLFFKIMLLALLEPVADQTMYYSGLRDTSATFASVMTNILPSVAFVMAWIFRMEIVNIREFRSQAKIIGTLTSLGGAMFMTLYRGVVIKMPWSAIVTVHTQTTTHGDDTVKGATLIVASRFCWAAFVILQAMVLKEYPAEISLTALVCVLGTLQGTVVAFVGLRGDTTAWAFGFDIRLIATLYGGIISSALTYYLQGSIMKRRGPVFVTSFAPLSMVVVAIMGSVLLAEKLFLGSLIGAIIIIFGLYSVIWGKLKDNSTSLPQELPLDKLSQLNPPKHDCRVMCDQDNHRVAVGV